MRPKSAERASPGPVPPLHAGVEDVPAQLQVLQLLGIPALVFHKAVPHSRGRVDHKAVV